MTIMGFSIAECDKTEMLARVFPQPPSENRAPPPLRTAFAQRPIPYPKLSVDPPEGLSEGLSDGLSVGLCVSLSEGPV